MDVKSEQSVIKIQRKEQFWVKGTYFKVYIDEKMVGNIGSNSIQEFSVDPGQHKISIKIGWSQSNEMMIQSDSGKTSTLMCGCNGPVLNLIFIMVFMQFFIRNILNPFHLGIQLERTIDIYYFVVVFIITVILTFIPTVMAYIKIIEPTELN